jgi:hypothetical protein
VPQLLLRNPNETYLRPPSAPKPTTDLNALIAAAAKDLADYQRLTAEGKLAEAGRKLEDLKRKLDELQAHQRNR